MTVFLLILELIGTLAFAASGALIGLKKNMDIFGVCILGLTTAVGGGVIRDVILGNTPPATFQNPVYATVAIATALVHAASSTARKNSSPNHIPVARGIDKNTRCMVPNSSPLPVISAPCPA